MIWQRYIFKELLKTFFCFVVGFYALWVMIDYAIHLKYFLKATSHWRTVGIYYAFRFCAEAPLILGFAVTLAIIRVTLQLNQQRQQVILFGAGISLNRLLRPLILFCTLVGCLLWANFAFFAPEFDPTWQTISKTFFYFESFDPITNTYSQVFWIDPSGIIYQMHALVIGAQEATGHFVQRLDTALSHTSSLTEQYASMSFALSDLFEPETHSKRVYWFYQGICPLTLMLFPWLFISTTLRFSRTTSPFLIYSLAIGGLLVLSTFLQGALLIGHRFNIIWPVFLPITLISLLAYIIYQRNAHNHVHSCH